MGISTNNKQITDRWKLRENVKELNQLQMIPSIIVVFFHNQAYIIVTDLEHLNVSGTQ